MAAVMMRKMLSFHFFTKFVIVLLTKELYSDLSGVIPFEQGDQMRL
jgi:hypothetical protein